MEDVIEYVERTENEALKQTLLNRLGNVTKLLPGPNVELLVHCLSLIDTAEQSKFISYLQQEEVINNKTVMLSVMNLLISFKTTSDTIQACLESNTAISEAVSAVTARELDVFRDGVASTVAFALEELQNAAQNINEGMRRSEEYVKTEFAVLETAYQERSKNLESSHRKKLEELETQFNVKLKQVELVMTEKANREIQKNLLPFFRKNFGWRGVGLAILIMTSTLFLHDGIKWLFFQG